MDAIEKKDMTTLVACSNALLNDGFTENFKITNEGLEAPSKGKIYSPSEVKIVNFYRFEGDSDPADNSILYALETDDHVLGTLIDAYGAYANQKVTTFMAEIDEISKREPSNGEGHSQTLTPPDVE